MLQQVQVILLKIYSLVYEKSTGAQGQKPSKYLSKFFKGKKNVSSDNAEEASKEPTEIMISPAQIKIYSSKLEFKKGAKPIGVMKQVYLAYALWPESIKDVKNDAVDEIKIMGTVDFYEGFDLVFGSTERKRDMPQNTIFLQSLNTHESLHWLVAVLGAFALDANIVATDINAAVWSEPPTGWGEICLDLDEIAGLSGKVSVLESFIEYAKLLVAKKKMLKRGLFDEWKLSVSQSVSARRQYERKEVELKANLLILWYDKLKNGEMELPNWVGSELTSKIGDSENLVYEECTESEISLKNNIAESMDEKVPGMPFKYIRIVVAKERHQVGLESCSINENNGEPPFRRIPSLNRNAAKMFLTKLSEVSTKKFEMNKDLPSSLWYQEEQDRIKTQENVVV